MTEENLQDSSSSYQDGHKDETDQNYLPHHEEEIQIHSLHTIPSRRYYLTRRGKIMQSTTERYLRDDLGYGTILVSISGRIHDGRPNTTFATPMTLETISDLRNHLLAPILSCKNTNSTSLERKQGGQQQHQQRRQRRRRRRRLVILDANILLHHMDVLEHESCAISNAVIPQTALEECKNRSLVAYRRAVDLIRSGGHQSDGNVTNNSGTNNSGTNNSGTNNSGSIAKESIGKGRRCFIFFANVHHVETQYTPPKSIKGAAEMSINDENDARLRKVAYFYGRALCRHQEDVNDDDDDDDEDDVEVVFLSDDVNSRQLALLEQPASPKRYYTPRSMREHVALLQKEDPALNLLDLVAQFNSAPIADASNTGSSRPELYYAPHVPSDTLSSRLQTNHYFQGIFRCDRDSYASGYVTIRRGDDRVAVIVRGKMDVNRAVDGDVVALQLHPLDNWLKGGEHSDDDNDNNQKETQKKDNDTKAGIAADTAEPTFQDMENITDEMAVDDTGEQLRRPTGKIVGIIRRNFHKNYCGSIYTVMAPTSEDVDTNDPTNDKNDNMVTTPTHSSPNTIDTDKSPHEYDIIAAKHEREHPDSITSTVVFFPIDPRTPPILIRTTQRDRLLGMRILVTMDSWPADSEYPLGHYVKTLGVAGTKDTETQVLLQEFRIPCEPFPAKVLACLPPPDYKIDIENSPNRTDLRHLPVLSIDPPGCKDIDDALHCTELPNGNWQVGVHIADVTHYVEAGTAIDLEAANRSTSTYLVNKRLDMLPSLLTTDLCSLKGNVDRFAFSVLWEVTPEAEIVDVDFKKTIIHSIAALTYQQAQSLIDKPDKDCKHDIQAGAVKRLAALARKFRARRIKAGALTLASPEVKFVLDSESLNPTDVQAYTLFEANALVEEFMLLANVTVSKKILRHYPTLSVLRRHPAPNRSMFDGLISKAKCRGIILNIEDSKTLADSLDAAVSKSDPYLNQLLRILSTRCMSPAQYFCSGEYRPKDWHHYGLAAPVYTHFTSPIRRYADVCVHRLLAAAIGVAPLPVFLSSKSYLHDLAATMNRRHRAAQLAGRASVQLHTLLFFSDGDGKGGTKEEDAYVLDVETTSMSEPSFTVMVPRYGIEGRVRLTNIAANDERLVREPDRHRLSYKNKSGKIIASVAVFDKVRVKIWVKNGRYNQNTLVVDLVEPRVLANPAQNNHVTEENSFDSDPSSNTTKGKKKRKKASHNN